MIQVWDSFILEICLVNFQPYRELGYDFFQSFKYNLSNTQLLIYHDTSIKNSMQSRAKIIPESWCNAKKQTEQSPVYNNCT